MAWVLEPIDESILLLNRLLSSAFSDRIVVEGDVDAAIEVMGRSFAYEGRRLEPNLMIADEMFYPDPSVWLPFIQQACALNDLYEQYLHLPKHKLITHIKKGE